MIASDEVEDISFPSDSGCFLKNDRLEASTYQIPILVVALTIAKVLQYDLDVLTVRRLKIL